MTAYFLAALNVHDAATFQKYLEASAGSGDFEVEALAMDDTPVVLEGLAPGRRIVLAKFKSKAELMRWWESDGYRKAVPLRRASAETPFCLMLDGWAGGSSEPPRQD